VEIVSKGGKRERKSRWLKTADDKAANSDKKSPEAAAGGGGDEGAEGVAQTPSAQLTIPLCRECSNICGARR